MTKYIIGVHAGHNASAAIGDTEGNLIYAAQEERFNYEKNYWGFPVKSIRACMDYVGAEASDIERIVSGQRSIPIRYHSREDVLKAYQRHESVVGRLRQGLLVPLFLKLKKDHNQDKFLARLKNMGLGNIPVEFEDHHRGHAGTAYYGLRESKDERALVLTCDGDGDGLCASVRVCENGEERIIATTEWANSLGAIYSWVTFATGFVPLEHEYKLMGMGAYAPEDRAKENSQIFHDLLGFDDEHGLTFKRKKLEYISNLRNHFFSELEGKRFDWICAGVQRFTEDFLCQWVENCVRYTGISTVRAAGGVFMNVKANKRISDLDCVERFEAFPSCGDESLSIGAYYLSCAKHHGSDKVEPLQSYYLGDTIDDERAEAAIQSAGFRYERPKNIAKAVADALVEGEPLARVSGRMEFGARALGNRSILADPSNQDVVRVVNQMVKKRDFWMPFAPMMKSDRQDTYIANPKKLSSPYMMMTFDARDNYKEFIAAVHNADLTCRAQLLEEEQNPEMYAIINEFQKKTGRSVVLNTSYNIHGLPLVRNEKQALDVFANTGLTRMQLGSFMVYKD